MLKLRLFIPIIITLICSACAVQTTPSADPPTPSAPIESSPTLPPTSTTPPTSTPTKPPPPSSITDGNQYPWIYSSSDLFNRVVSINPANPDHMAYCAPGEIRVSLDAGQTWEQPIPTTGVTAAAQERGYIIFDGDPATADACHSVTLDPSSAGTFYAEFTVAQVEYGAPPVFYMGFFSTDRGATWQFVDPPATTTLEDFGGFWNLDGQKVQAQFLVASQLDQPVENTLISETSNGAADWEIGKLSCPSVGPCLRWGPAPSNIPGMGSPLPQSILHSMDGGDTWLVIDPPVELRAPAPNQLVAISDMEVSIISGGIGLTNSTDETQVMRASLDAGGTWQPVTLPPILNQDSDINYFPGLQYLSNHSYLSQAPEDSTWYWLSPSLPLWCPVNSDRLPSYPVLLQNVGDQVWWVDQETQQADHLSLSEINCSVK